LLSLPSRLDARHGDIKSLVFGVRIPMKPAGDSDLKAATHSDLKAATIPI
jgi:hypothetical protein